jgi:membrane protein implicated in regulation of membrane protease activity
MAEENSYPAVRFMLRFSKLFALILGLAVAAGELWAAAARLGWWRTAAGVVGGLLVFFFVRFFAELVHKTFPECRLIY